MRPNLEPQMEEFRRRCREAGLALTHQREMIYRAVLESEGHPSPEGIYERVKRRIPAISLATVYKNIRTFLEAGLVKEVTLHHGALRLESNPAEHHHLVCVRCRAIIDLDGDSVAPVRLRRKPPAGCRILRYSVEFQGLCPGCARKTTRNLS
ncbi:MAG: transcriptional repressor [Bryobacteraceae bacterium]|nr:transcriptional repressor [Bryobacteraceae bacterium]MCX7602438.1 transcriptional repressor [Bryobacteraceae bacterium]MDW8434536.1 transcriptional repressor [Arcobacter sp.]